MSRTLGVSIQLLANSGAGSKNRSLKKLVNFFVVVEKRIQLRMACCYIKDFGKEYRLRKVKWQLCNKSINLGTILSLLCCWDARLCLMNKSPFLILARLEQRQCDDSGDGAHRSKNWIDQWHTQGKSLQNGKLSQGTGRSVQSSPRAFAFSFEVALSSVNLPIVWILGPDPPARRSKRNEKLNGAGKTHLTSDDGYSPLGGYSAKVYAIEGPLWNPTFLPLYTILDRKVNEWKTFFINVSKSSSWPQVAY